MEQECNGVAAQALKDFSEILIGVADDLGVGDMTKEQMLECANAFRCISIYAKDMETTLKDQSKACRW